MHWHSYVSPLSALCCEGSAILHRLSGPTLRKLRHYHLKDTFQDGDRAYKLPLSETDRVTLKALVDGAPMPDNYSIGIKENYDRFSEWMKSADLDAMSRGIARVMIEDIALERGHDNPQLIFQSLNSTRKALA